MRQNTTKQQGSTAVADQKHVEMLRFGVEVWNGWREQNPEVIHTDLSGTDLSGANLNKANLNKANPWFLDAISHNNFDGCFCSQAQITHPCEQ